MAAALAKSRILLIAPAEQRALPALTRLHNLSPAPRAISGIVICALAATSASTDKGRGFYAAKAGVELGCVACSAGCLIASEFLQRAAFMSARQLASASGAAMRSAPRAMKGKKELQIFILAGALRQLAIIVDDARALLKATWQLDLENDF